MSTAYQSQPTQLQSVANNPYASASLYVGDLAPEVTEATLFELFNAVGPVASIRVCRDSTTRRSLGYAYVNFHSVQDAERALDTMNFTNIRGRQCRIMWSQRDPVLRKSGKGNIFVKNLHTSIDNKTLYDTFSVFGSILSCKVMTNKNGQSLGYGYVHYASDDSATKAIEGVNGMLISDKEVVAQRFLPREERLKSTKYTKFTNVYVKYIPKDWTEDKLKTLIAEKVPNAKVTSLVFWKESYGVSSCINFGDPEQAKDVVEKLNDLLVNAEDTLHPKLYVARAMDRAERDFYLKKQKKAKYGGRKTFFGVNLYTKNLPEDTDDVKLREMFEPYGKITSAKVMTDPKTGRSRGFGFVCFERKEDASRAMTELNSKNLGGKPLYVSRAQRKAVRAAWLAKQRSRFQQQMYMPSGMQRPPFQQQQPYYSQFRQQPPPYPRSMPMQYPQMFPQAAPPFGQVSQQKPFSNVPQQGFVQHHQGFPQQFSQPIQSRPQVQYGTQFSVPRNISGANQPSVAPVPGSQPADGSSVGVSGVPHMGAPQQQMSSAPQGQQPSAPMADHTPLTVQMLNSVKAEERKRLIGERLFPKIQAVEPRLAGKITGMLLEMDNTELLHLLETQHALMAKINEALQVLKEHMSQKNPSQKNPGSGAQSSQRGVNPQE